MAPDDASPDASAPAAAPSRGKARKAAETVANVAYAFRHRDAIVQNALDVLSETGILDPMQRERVWDVYQRGDARTRLFIQDIVARILRVPLERLETTDVAGRLDPATMPAADLEALQGLALPQVDLGAVADRVRGLDVNTLLGRREAGRVLTLLSDAPVFALMWWRRFLVLGIVLFLIAVAGLAFPRYAAVIGLYSFLILLALLAAYLVHLARVIERTAKKLDVDLSVYAKLAPTERRILLGRRLLLKVIDPDALGDVVEKGLRMVVPDALQKPPEGAPRASPPPAAARPPVRTSRAKPPAATPPPPPAPAPARPAALRPRPRTRPTSGRAAPRPTAPPREDDDG